MGSFCVELLSSDLELSGTELLFDVLLAEELFVLVVPELSGELGLDCGMLGDGISLLLSLHAVRHKSNATPAARGKNLFDIILLPFIKSICF